MERLTRVRINLLILLFCVVLVFFGLKLYDMQVIATSGNTDNRSTFTTWTRVKASRGDMLDTNGNILVGNRASYDLVINHYVLASANGTNDHLYRLVMLCRELGIEYNDHFPVSLERPFTYTLTEYSSAWQSYFQKFLNHVGGLDSDITAALLMERLREYYGIPISWNDYEARLVIGVWYEMSLRNCVSSLPNYVFLSDADEESLSAIIELKVTPKAGLGFEDVAAKVMKYPEVESVYLMSGVYDLNVVVKGKTFQDVAKFVAKELSTIESVTSTATHFVLRRYKELDVELLGAGKDERGSYLL